MKISLSNKCCAAQEAIRATLRSISALGEHDFNRPWIQADASNSRHKLAARAMWLDGAREWLYFEITLYPHIRINALCDLDVQNGRNADTFRTSIRRVHIWQLGLEMKRDEPGLRHWVYRWEMNSVPKGFEAIPQFGFKD